MNTGGHESRLSRSQQLFPKNTTTTFVVRMLNDSVKALKTDLKKTISKIVIDAVLFVCQLNR